jgi:hypothetical protein
VLCSKHFVPSDFEPDTEHSQRRRLKKGATPTIFNYPLSLQPKVERERPSPKVRKYEEKERKEVNKVGIKNV